MNFCGWILGAALLSAQAAAPVARLQKACAEVGVFGRIGAGTQIDGAITSGFCKPSAVGPYDERYIPRFARLMELLSSRPPTAMHDGALAGGKTG